MKSTNVELEEVLVKVLTSYILLNSKKPASTVIELLNNVELKAALLVAKADQNLLVNTKTLSNTLSYIPFG